MIMTLSSLHRTFFSSSRNCLANMSTIRGLPMPSCSKFIPVDKSENNSKDGCDGFKFRLVSYNILAQVYVKSSLFPHSPSPCLRWKARSGGILAVLKSFAADFLCLQELDEYDGFYKENIESLGYSSIYIQRSGKKRDGCGVFYKHNSAELILEEKIDYNDLVSLVKVAPSLSGSECADVPTGANKEDYTKDGLTQNDSVEGRGDPNDPLVRLKRDCVGIMAAFKLKEPSHIVIVANTHLYWDPEWADVKLAQAKYLLSRLSQFRMLVSNRFECTPSIIVSGDFNSTPGDEVYRYLISGSSSLNWVKDCADLPMPLCSVYASTGGEPAFTNCTPDFTGTLDYILFSPSLIKPVSVLQVPGSDAPDVAGGLPNFHHPSDHLPIGAEFTINERQTP